MKTARSLVVLISVLAFTASPAKAWFWNDGATYRNYSTTTFVVRPYNAFSDMSCSLSMNGNLPISLIGQCLGGGCGNFGGGCGNNGCCPPRCGPCCYPPPCYYYPPPPPHYSGWPSLYYNYGGCQTCAYPPAMYYPAAAYYPPPPPIPQNRKR